MRRALGALVSRCVGVGSSSAASSELAREAARGSAYVANALVPAGTPRSCLWLMQLAQAPHEPLLPHAVRQYAKAAAAAPAAKGGAAAGPKRHRTSTTKLYSCRNDRLRHTHEQIWPTVKLTEPELNMFKRNSRLFVVDMGRSISLQTKYRLGQFNPAQLHQHQATQGDTAAEQNAEEGASSVGESGRKVPYQQARTLLYESQMHMDALGENPRYLKLRRVRSQFAAKMQNVRKLRLLLGFQRRYVVQRMYEQALLTPGSHRMWKMVCAMESNLAMFVTRMGLADDAVAGVQAVKHNKLYVNGRDPPMPNRGSLLPGDIVSPSAGSTAYFRKKVANSMKELEGDVIRCVTDF